MSARLPRWLALSLGLLLAFVAARLGAETLPPPPAAFFNDYAHVVPADTARVLNARLEQFERDTSNQLVVAVFSRMESKSSVEDYTVRVAQSWHAGQKGKDNGAVLFVFVESHQIYIQVGYGLEGALPDATCKAIIDNELKPAFRAGDFGGGLSAAVNAMIAATKGEYKGSGRTQAGATTTVHGGGGSNSGSSTLFVIVVIFVLIYSLFTRGRGRGRTYGSSSSSGGWSSGGGGGGSSSGGFSGGGGSFGGGGSGGSW